MLFIEKKRGWKKKGRSLRIARDAERGDKLAILRKGTTSHIECR